MKRENRTINKNNLTEIKGTRQELKDMLGEKLTVEGFVTNSIGYSSTKRLVTEIRIKDWYINHAWFKTNKIGNLPHGYQRLRVQVTEYINQETGDIKYGLRYIGEKGKPKNQNNKLIKPKWMEDE